MDLSMHILSVNRDDFYGELLVASFTVQGKSLFVYDITNWAFFPDPEAPGKMSGLICAINFNGNSG